MKFELLISKLACALFSSLDEKAPRDIAAYAKRRSFAAGEPICRLGDQGDSMMAVVIGTVRISLPTARGREVILADLRPGELFGEIALLDGKPPEVCAKYQSICIVEIAISSILNDKLAP